MKTGLAKSMLTYLAKSLRPDTRQPTLASIQNFKQHNHTADLGLGWPYDYYRSKA